MWPCALVTEKVVVVTQGETSLVVPTLGEGSISFRRHLSAAEAPVTESRGERPSWQERMGLSLAEALRLPGLAGTEVVAGHGGLDRVVRYMVVDDPADPLAVAGAGGRAGRGRPPGAAGARPARDGADGRGRLRGARRRRRQAERGAGALQPHARPVHRRRAQRRWAGRGHRAARRLP